jgi:hypothetical protein
LTQKLKPANLHFSPYFIADHVNGAEDYISRSRRSPSPSRDRSRSRSPRGYLSVRKSPELRARSASPSREAVQAAARHAAEAAIRLADAEDRKSPIAEVAKSTSSPRATPEKIGRALNGSLESRSPPPPPTSAAAIQNMLAGLGAASPLSLFGLQQQQQQQQQQHQQQSQQQQSQLQLLASNPLFATLAAFATAAASNPPPVSMAAPPGFPGAGLPGQADQGQAFQALAQLFLLNPAAANPQMMLQQQVNQ